MAVLVDEHTRVIVQGLTGREGSFHARRNREYGTQIVAGVTPGKGSQTFDATPVFDTVAQAADATHANASLIFVPAPFAADAVIEAYESEMPLIVCITEGIPAHDMARVKSYMGRSGKSLLIGPNCPGLISPGRANLGIIPGEICSEGAVGLISRSGTLTYQIIHELTRRRIGQSSCVGIGGDPIVGTSFVDMLERFEGDSQTKVVVLVGEIGGSDEQAAAAFVSSSMSKPVVAYIAGFTAPPGRRMGHAGAIASEGAEGARAKAEALAQAGVAVARSPTDVGDLVAAALRGL